MCLRYIGVMHRGCVCTCRRGPPPGLQGSARPRVGRSEKHSLLAKMPAAHGINTRLSFQCLGALGSPSGCSTSSPLNNQSLSAAMQPEVPGDDSA